MIKEKAMDLADALESEKFKQGLGKLKQEFEDEIYHCCLGVAGELSGLEWSKDPDFGTYPNYAIDGECFDLPRSVQEEFGFYNRIGARRDRQPILINGRSFTSLADANDQGVPFKDQAAYIRKNHKYL